MLRHGTRLMGSQINAKLVEDQVQEIRRLRYEGARYSELAATYGVTSQNVANIVHRRSWRHLGFGQK
jgi:DNA-directed RNA polymerase specialized sigma24 family protein